MLEKLLKGIPFIGMFLFFLLLNPINMFGAKRIVISESNFRTVFSQSGCVYVVKTAINLKGGEVKIPENSALKFKRRGKMTNGTVVGAQTKLVGMKNGCLGVTLKGEWILPTIKDTYFDSSELTDNQILENIYTVQSMTLDNIIYLSKPEYQIVLTSKHKQGLKLKSNAILHLNSTLKVVGNDLPQYTVVSAGDNTKILGGRIIGDVGSHTYVEGTTSQWGFGISISNVKDVTIDGLYVTRCTGDGIYIGGGIVSDIGDYSQASKNIVLKGILSDDNRRQGLSITCADGVYVENCTFSNTGKTESTRPGCGLDIEPNKGQSVRNVTFKNCKFLNNNEILEASIGGYQSEGEKCNVEKILLEDCIATGPISVRSGSVILRRCNMETLSIHLAKMPKDKVLIENCIIEGGSGVSIRSVGGTTDKDYLPVYTFKDCSIRMNEVLTRSIFSMINHKGNEVAEFKIENCELQFPAGSQKFGMVPEKMSCDFDFNNCSIVPSGHSLDLNKKMFINCRIVNK